MLNKLPVIPHVPKPCVGCGALCRTAFCDLCAPAPGHVRFEPKLVHKLDSEDRKHNGKNIRGPAKPPGL